VVVNLKIYEDLSSDDPRRFYPSSVPVFNMEPLKDFFTILKSPEDIREGVVTLISFKEGDLICKGTGFFLNTQTLHSLQYQEDKVYIHDPFFIGKVLHSCDSNSYLDVNTFSLYAKRDIKVFETLTIYYPETEAELYQEFDCTCGSDKCIKYVTGYKKINKESINGNN
jgi:hypothetical protein